ADEQRFSPVSATFAVRGLQVARCLPPRLGVCRASMTFRMLSAETARELATDHIDGDLPSWLREPWECLRTALASRGRAAGPFLGFDWARIYAHELRERVGPPRTFLAWRGRELVGAIGLVAEHRRLAHAPARILRSLSDDHSQRWDALVTDRAVA